MLKKVKTQQLCQCLVWSDDLSVQSCEFSKHHLTVTEVDPFLCHHFFSTLLSA